MDDTFLAQAHVRSITAQDGALILDLEKGIYYSFNGVGARIWEGITNGQSARLILKSLKSRYQATTDTLQADLNNFIHELKKKGLVHVTG